MVSFLPPRLFPDRISNSLNRVSLIMLLWCSVFEGLLALASLALLDQFPFGVDVREWCRVASWVGGCQRGCIPKIKFS